MRSFFGAICLSLLMLATAAQAQRAATRAPEDRFVTVNGMRLHYLEWGDAGAPPLVLLHGIDRIAHTFDHVAPRFADRYRVIAMDLRGHGDSGWDPDGRYLVEDHAGDLEGLVKALGLRNITLWGNSTGGRVVQVFAGLHPDLVAAVIAEDVGPERPRSIADAYARRVKQEENGWASTEELLAQMRKAAQPLPDAVLEPYVRYGTKRREDGRVVWKRDPNLVKGFVETELWRYVRAIEAPVLYVLGGRSTIVPAATQDELKKVLPQVRIVTMPGLGHYPSDERPEEFVKIVDEFLKAQASRLRAQARIQPREPRFRPTAAWAR
jgi:pimeloyl-ACP methyl ester carboxylesterase